MYKQTYMLNKKHINRNTKRKLKAKQHIKQRISNYINPYNIIKFLNTRKWFLFNGNVEHVYMNDVGDKQLAFMSFYPMVSIYMNEYVFMFDFPMNTIEYCKEEYEFTVISKKEEPNKMASGVLRDFNRLKSAFIKSVYASYMGV